MNGDCKSGCFDIGLGDFFFSVKIWISDYLYIDSIILFFIFIIIPVLNVAGNAK